MKFRAPYLSPRCSSPSDSASSSGAGESSQRKQSTRDYDSSRRLNFPTLQPGASSEELGGGAAVAREAALGDETTDVRGAFSECHRAASCEEGTHRPMEVRGVQAQDLLVPVEAASWLHTFEDYEGYWLVEWTRADDEAPIHLVVGEGRIFYGVARRCRSWCDEILRRDHRELCQAYRDYQQRHRTESAAISMMDLLIDVDKFPLDGRQRQALQAHLGRILSPRTAGKGKRWRLDPQPFEDHAFLSFEPARVLEAFGMQMGFVDDLMRGLSCLNIEPLDGWLFSSGELGVGPLICSTQSVRQSLEMLPKVAGRTDELLRSCAMTPAWDRAIAAAIGVRGDELWLCVADDELVAVSRHPLVHMGRVFRLLEGLSACRESSDAPMTLSGAS